MKFFNYVVLLSICLGTVMAHAETQEHQAIKACEQYVALGKQKYPNEYFLTCKGLNRSPNEWKCMINKRINQNWSYHDSVNSCFKSAPALAVIKKQLKNPENLKASDVCKVAYKTFSTKGEKLGMSPSALCDFTERNAVMWTCMATLAHYGNSYLYSSGQCFPREKLS